MSSEIDLNEENLINIYELKECEEWIKQNNFRSTALQFSEECLQNSSKITLILKTLTKTEFYISYSTMCCVDYLSVKHLNDSTIDSIIYFGGVCLTSSQFTDSLPVLYVFGKKCESDSLEFIESSILEMDSNKVIILYNTFNTFMALEVMNKIKTNEILREKVSIAKLNSISNKWYFTESVLNVINDNQNQSNDSSVNLGPFLLTDKIEKYDLVVYLGKCLSLNLILNCNKLLEIVVNNRTKRLIYANKELYKRVALIEKFKQKSCQSVGVVFTNPLPKVSQLCAQSKQFGKKLKKKIYFISLVQTIDEYKLGNFGELNAFVVVNSCFCSSALKSIDYCLPVLNWEELEIASGIKRIYGGVVWNESPDLQLSDSDNESEENQLCNQLIETKVFENNKWFGLEVNAGSIEASIVKTGQTGIASVYQNENLL